jgi:hypothetical protein
VSAVSIAPADRFEPVSPELALVDPVLRRRLQALEQERPPFQWTPPPRAPAAVQPQGSDVPNAQLASTRGRRTSSSSLGRPGLSVVAIACAAAFVLGAKLAGPSALPPAAVNGPASSAQLVPPSDLRGTVNRSRQRLAWAPVAGATGYQVAFYHQSERVYLAHTTLPRVDLSWAVRQALPHGALVWYVWPTHGGRPDSSPVVHSQLSLAP